MSDETVGFLEAINDINRSMEDVCIEITKLRLPNGIALMTDLRSLIGEFAKVTDELHKAHDEYIRNETRYVIRPGNSNED